MTYVELPRQERHVADEPVPGVLQMGGRSTLIMVATLSQDRLRILGPHYPVGSVGKVGLEGVGDLIATVIAATKDGMRLRLQTTDTQKEALLLRFYTEGGTPGIGATRAFALARDLFRRLT